MSNQLIGLHTWYQPQGINLIKEVFDDVARDCIETALQSIRRISESFEFDDTFANVQALQGKGYQRLVILLFGLARRTSRIQ